jgi:hypothetical protein
MKVTATATGTVPASRLGRRIAEALSSQSIERYERELVEELDAVAVSERTADADTRRDTLERAVRRVWGAPL